MGEKLTKAQRELLAQAEYGVHCVKAYKPAQRLVALGLAEWRDDDDYGGILDATPAGRAALTPLEGGGNRASVAGSDARIEARHDGPNSAGEVP